jgi:cytochrome c-type protein NapC
VTGKRSSSRLKWLFISAGAVAILVFLISIPIMERTSRTEYCVSCHELKSHKTELEKSSHAVDKDKKPIQCRQCHIPNGFGLKYLIVKTMGVKDLWVHKFGDPENLNRRELQVAARRYIQDDNCRACHQDLLKTTKDEKISEIGRLAHEAYLGKNGNTRNGCAGCHPNMAHLPVFDRRYPFNAEFAKNLPPVQEQ